jgi:signal transduction histidine kinase
LLTHRLRHPSAPALTLAGWGAGVALTLVIVTTEVVVFAYRSPELHLVLNTVDAGVALLLAYLLHGRFTRSRRLQDLLLAQAMVLLGVAGLALTLVLEHVGGYRRGTLDVWLPLVLRVVAGMLVLAAALNDRPVVSADRARWARAFPWLLMVAGFAVLWALRGVLPVALAQSAPATAAHPVLTGHPVLLGAQGLTAVCFLTASALFAQQAGHRSDELLRWLGPACALAGFARVSYVLFPSLYSDWVYTGDLLRTGCYLLLLLGAAREIGQYWSAQARAAVLEDRRRLARELHDGVVQELGYIRVEAQALTPGDRSAVERITAACDRGLDEARAAVDALGRSPAEPLGFVLHRAARQVAERYDARVDVDLDDSVIAEQDLRHALVRITREAVSNAIRHGGAQRVCVRLVREGERQRLVVQDDGQGFDPSAVARTGTGYGLTSMQERARALQGSFLIDSAPGRGTTVAVTW